MEEKKTNESRLYSYHTFLYPFRISAQKDGKSIKVPFEPDPAIWEEIESVPNIGNASPIKLATDALYTTDEDDRRKKTKQGQYYIDQMKRENTYRYFLPAARQMLFPEKSSNKEARGSVRFYRWKNPDAYCMEFYEQAVKQAETEKKKEEYKQYDFSDSLNQIKSACIPEYENCSKYYIRQVIRAEEETIIKTYVLRLIGMSLRYFEKYHTGILQFETAYFGEIMVDGEEGVSLSETPWADVKAINDLGRRVYTPCYDIADLNNPVTTAKELKIELRVNGQGEQKTYSISFPTRERMDQGIDAFQKIVFGEQPKEQIDLRFKGILDERMFTVCLVCNKELSDRVTKWDMGRDAIIDRDYYEFAFADQDKDCTCQDDVMLRELLRKHSYTRWKNYGSVYWLSEYSMTGITGDAAELRARVVNPFLTMYTDMVQAALIQRTIMEELKTEAQERAEELDSYDESKCKDLWKRYTFFQNTLFLHNVTFQEQGVEMYDMMKEFLRISEINANLNGEIAQLREYAELESADRRAAVTGALTDVVLIGTVETILAAAASAPKLRISRSCAVGGALVLVYLLVKIGRGFFDWFCANQRIKKRQKPWRFKAELWRLFVYLVIIILTVVVNYPRYFPI